MPISKSDAIIIVGAGAWGLSTALRLSEAGYTNITVLDKGGEVPSSFSAANDVNKILRPEYEDPFYMDLTLEAFEAWKTPLFAPHYHQTGFLNCVSELAPEKAYDTMSRFRAAAENHPVTRNSIVPINGKQDVVNVAWQFQNGPLPGWRGYFNRHAGYAHSANALIAVHKACVGLGVRFLLGQKGDVVEIIYGTTSQGERQATGVKTRDGAQHPAKLAIVAVGASANRLIPELGQRVVAKSWSVAHVQLTDDEASVLRGIPVTYARDLGFFFEPEPKTNLLKLCPMGGGYVNTDKKTGISYPPATLEESAFLPAHDEARLRKLLAHTLPALADRPFVNKFLCWFADTNDSDYIVDYVPETSRSVIVLSGDSGHGFKMMPIVGNWIKSLLEVEDGKQSVAQWRWKTLSKEENWGDDVSWRLGTTEEYEQFRPAVKAKL